MTRLQSLLRNLFCGRSVDQALDDELQAAVEILANERVAAGLTPAEARRQALIAFGGVEQVKEGVRLVRAGHFAESLWQDVRYAIRTLRKSPGFTATAVVTLALGIGATTAIFAAVDAIVLRPLPFDHPEALVAVGSRQANSAVSDIDPTPPQDFLDWRDRQRVFEHIAAFSAASLTLEMPGQTPDALDALRVSSEFFDVLRVRPALGRMFARNDEVSGNHRVVVLGHELWLRNFGGAADIIGKTILLEGEPYEVVGITPRSSSFPSWSIGHPQVWVPLLIPDEDRIRSPHRRRMYLGGVARLDDGVSLERAASAMDQIGAALEAERPEWNANSRISVVPLGDHVSGGSTRSWMFLLLGAVLFVFLIVCANVANLTLARAGARGHEIAIRAALGASRPRLIRQLLVENLMLSLGGSLAGLTLARWGTEILRSAVPDSIPRATSIALDPRVVAASIGAAVVTGLIFGLLPAVRHSRLDLRQALNAGGRTLSANGSTWRLRRAIVAIEISFAVVLLVGAGLFVRSFTNVMRVDLGFDPGRVLSGSISLRVDQQGNELGSTVEDVLARIRHVPGVELASAFAGTVPLYGAVSSSYGPGDRIHFSYQYVTADYHRVMRIPLRQGRYLQDRDRDGAAPVMLINETAARTLFPGQDPIGQIATRNRQVVGVVGDVRVMPERDVKPMAYVPLAQSPADRDFFLAVRTAGEPFTVLPAVRAAVSDVLPGVAVREARSLASVLSDVSAQRRLSMQLLSVFGLLGVVIAVVGVYGLMAYYVSLRAKEIGLRIALGAARARIVWTFLSGALILAATGLTIGSLAAWWLSALARPFLFHLEPTDARVFTVALLLLAAAASVASVIPAGRAAKVNPVEALRSE